MMIHLVMVVLCRVYKTEPKVIHLVMVILTPMVKMICMMMENGGDIRN